MVKTNYSNNQEVSVHCRFYWAKDLKLDISFISTATIRTCKAKRMPVTDFYHRIVRLFVYPWYPTFLLMRMGKNISKKYWLPFWNVIRYLHENHCKYQGTWMQIELIRLRLKFNINKQLALKLAEWPESQPQNYTLSYICANWNRILLSKV